MEAEIVLNIYTSVSLLIIIVGKFQRFDWLRGVQLIINFCITKE